MSEPVRKIDPIPESYSPKDKPEILSMMEESAGKIEVRHISEINPFQNELEIFYLPASRVIGIEQSYKLHSGGDHAAVPQSQWARVMASEVWETIQSLPRVIEHSGFGWTCDYIPETDSFSYIVSVLTPVNTPVPDGCQFRDLPPTLVAAGLWDEPMGQVIEKMKQLGYTPRYGDKGCEWNAELYLNEEWQNPLPTPNGQEWRWLIPCKREEAK